MRAEHLKSSCYFASAQTPIEIFFGYCTLAICQTYFCLLIYDAAALMLFLFSMQTLFFVQLTSLETRKVLEQIINYVIYKVLSLLYFLSALLLCIVKELLHWTS